MPQANTNWEKLYEQRKCAWKPRISVPVQSKVLLQTLYLFFCETVVHLTVIIFQYNDISILFIQIEMFNYEQNNFIKQFCIKILVKETNWLWLRCRPNYISVPKDEIHAINRWVVPSAEMILVGPLEFHYRVMYIYLS